MVSRGRRQAAANGSRILDRLNRERAATEPDQPAAPARRGFYPPTRSAARPTSASFTRGDRELLFAVNARDHDGVPTCVLCGRQPLHLYGPGDDSKAVAGHIIAWTDGGLPILSNGRIECRRCSNREGRRRLGQARRVKQSRPGVPN